MVMRLISLATLTNMKGNTGMDISDTINPGIITSTAILEAVIHNNEIHGKNAEINEVV